MGKRFYFFQIMTVVVLLVMLSGSTWYKLFAQFQENKGTALPAASDIVGTDGIGSTDEGEGPTLGTLYVSNVTNVDSYTENEPTPILKAIEGWGNLRLGMTFEEINTVLQNEYSWIALRKSENQTPGGYFLETYKNNYFNKVQFQFDKNKVLYLLRMEMNPRFFSFIQLYNNLVEKYGPPQENSYIRVVWSDNERFMELYRNNVLVYVDKSNWQERLPDSSEGTPTQDRRKELLNTVFENL